MNVILKLFKQDAQKQSVTPQNTIHNEREVRH
jgi:hypothetical protein